MKRFFVSLLPLLFFANSFGSANDTVTHTLASIVRIEFYSAGEEGQPYTGNVCTGFMVAPKMALTAAHCVPADGVPFWVDGQASVVLKRDGMLALVDAPAKPVLHFAAGLKIQESVTSFGFAWGNMTILSRRVAAFKDGDFATDGPLAPGMSGGPTVNQAGDVVGINQAANSVVGVLCGVTEMLVFLAPH